MLFPLKLNTAARSGRLEDAEIHDRLPLGADLDGVPALDDTDVFDEMKEVLKLTGRLICRAAEVTEATDIEPRQAAVIRGERNAGDADLRGEVFTRVEL